MTMRDMAEEATKQRPTAEQCSREKSWEIYSDWVIAEARRMIAEEEEERAKGEQASEHAA